MLILFFLLLLIAPAYGQNVTLTWTDNSFNEDGFNIERASSLDGPFGAPIATVPTDVTSYVDKGLIVGDLSCYRVKAFNIIGPSAYSNVACGTVQALLGSNEQLTLALTQVVDPDPSLLVYYPFDEGKDTLAYDWSGRNLTGTMIGLPAWVLGKIGNALLFDGGTNRVVTPVTTFPMVSTVLFWAKRSGAGGGTLGRMFDKRTAGAEVLAFYNDDPSAVYRLLVAWSGGIGNWTIPQPGINVWHHFAIVYDGNSTTKPLIYMDGVPQVVTQVAAPSGSVTTNVDPVVIANRGAGDRGWNGLVDDFRVYGKALSQSAIQKAMAGQ